MFRPCYSVRASVFAVCAVWALVVPSTGAVDATAAGVTSKPFSTTPASRPNSFYPQLWLQVASGGQTSCGISTDQVGWCWGDSTQGQVGLGLNGHSASISAPNQPLDTGKTKWSEMAVGYEHVCGVHTNGSLWCWGDDSAGQLGDGGSSLQDTPVHVTGGAPQWSSVSAGTSHTCGVGTDHSLWCWGDNTEGQLGIGSTKSSNVPTQVAGMTWAAVSVGGVHTCATRIDQSLWCWGDNVHGELGIGSMQNQTSPVLVDKKSWSQVSSGVTHTCALSIGHKTARLVWCWGDSGVSTSITPMKVDKRVKSWVSVSAGDDETCGTRSNQQIYCWGTNSYGQLGQGDTKTHQKPTQVTFRLGWVTAVAGGMSTCAIRSDATLWCWGSNSFGQLGDHAREPRYLPTPVNDSTRWLDVGDSGGSHTCAISDVIHFEGDLYCWGVDDHGQLGDGATTDQILPELIGSDTWTDVTGGEADSCGVQTDKSLWCWGANDDGQLGLGNQKEIHSPKRVGDQSNWVEVSAGNNHTCAVDTDGGLSCWGDNGNGQLGDGSTTNSNVPVQISPSTGWSSVSAGVSHTCAIRNDATLWCWGDNSHGEIGDGTEIQRLSPVEVANDPRDFTQVDVGGTTSCAINSKQSLFCWGIDDHGQAGLGGGGDVTQPTQVVPGSRWFDVSVAADHSCGTTPPASSPELLCWGVARDGDLGDGKVSGEEVKPVRMLYQKGDPWYTVYTYDDRTCSEKAFMECFGDDSVGQIGDGSPAPFRLMPTTVFVIPD